jgi:hypothetical protein
MLPLPHADPAAVGGALGGIATVVGIVDADEPLRTRDTGDAAAEALPHRDGGVVRVRSP